MVEAVPENFFGVFGCEGGKAVAAAGCDEVDLVVYVPVLEAVLTGFGSHPTGTAPVATGSPATSAGPGAQPSALAGGRLPTELPVLQSFSEGRAGFSQLSH